MHIHGGQESCVSFGHRDNIGRKIQRRQKNAWKKQRKKNPQNPTIGNSCFYWVCTQLQHHPCCLKWNVGVALQSTERDGRVNEKWLLLLLLLLLQLNVLLIKVHMIINCISFTCHTCSKSNHHHHSPKKFDKTLWLPLQLPLLSHFHILHPPPSPPPITHI